MCKTPCRCSDSLCKDYIDPPQKIEPPTRRKYKTSYKKYNKKKQRMTKWKFIVEASMGWKSEIMSIKQIHNIKNHIVYLIQKNSISQNVNIQYEIYDEKKGTITFEFYSPASKTEILSLLSDVSFPGFLNFRLIEAGSWNVVIPPPFTPKYSKEVIEQTINDLKTDFEKKSEDEKNRIDLNIRTLKRYLNGCVSGHTDSDYETKIDIIMKELNK